MSGTVFHYFGGRGRGEVIRFMLHSNGVQYEETNFTFENWSEAKATGIYEFGQVPMLEIDGHRLVTSVGIERYLAQKFGLLPADSHQAYLVDSIVDFRNDIFTKIATFIFVKKDMEGLAAWFAHDVKASLAIIEARLVSNHGGDGFFVGEHKTWADYSIFQFIHDQFFLAGQEARKAVLAEVAPKLLAFTERFLASDAAIQNRIASRPEWPV
jgi:glutathione S-transferase